MAVITLRNIWLLPASLLAAMILTLAPMPDWGRYLRPDWIGLLAVYWSMVLPRTYSIGSAWLTGLLMDAMLTAPLGQNALSLVLVVYITSRMSEQLLSATVLQQTLYVILLLLTRQFISLWINGMTGHLPENLLVYFVPSLLSLLLWPWIFALMKRLCRHYRMI